MTNETSTTETAAVAEQSASPAPATKKASKKASKKTSKKEAKPVSKKASKKDAKPPAKKEAKPTGKKTSKATDGQPREGSKKAIVLDLLRRKNGATMAEIAKATDWQNHSIRGFISGTLTKKMGLTVESSKNEAGDRVYRIASK
ncbi:MAG TPA: DUF3489 domain-containing protein [Bryobacteraceae bacterium]|nr:DUF3489 domain-containing protein [Bryobacteraceae bacterium]